MVWKVEFSASAVRELGNLDKPIQKRITRFLLERVAPSEDPRNLGTRLQGTLGDFWRFRVGDYRLVCDIQADVITVTILRIGHRKEVYRDVVH